MTRASIETVAVKILSPDAATPERLRRFEQEARSASTLNHPNILTIYDCVRRRSRSAGGDVDAGEEVARLSP